MAADITQDILYNLVCNVGDFAEGIERGLANLDDLDRGFTKLEKSVSFVSKTLSVFAGVALLEGVKLLGRGIANVARGIGNLTERLGEALVATEEVGSRWENLGLILKRGIGGPLWDTIIGIVSNALDRITALFRTEGGQWTDAFYRLRAIVTVFAGWLTSLWERLMGKMGDSAESWLDRFVNALVRAIQGAASLLRRFASFVAGIFGGAGPAEVTEAAVARTGAAPMARPEAVTPLVGEEKAPKAAKAAKPIKPVAPPAAEDLKQMSILTGAWAEATKRLAQASAAAAKARTAMAKAEDWLERASEKVYDIRRKIQRLELDWAEIPERFIRGRKRQLQIELQAAQHEEHERKKVVDAERERMQLAEQYERQAQKIADNVKRQMDTLANSIERQAERYADYLEKLREAEAEQEEVAKKTWDAFKGIEIPPGILEDIEGKLQPAFADIELSVASIAESLGLAWEKGKLWAGDLWVDLKGIKTWLEGVAERIVATFDEIIKKVRELWAEIEPMVEKVKDWLPEAGERKSKVELWKETAEVRKEGKSQAERWAEGLRDGQPAVEAATKTTFFDTVSGVFNDLADLIYRRSLVPDLVNNVVDWFDRMEIDTSAILDRLIGQVNLLDTAAQGLMPKLADLGLASGGNFKLVTVNLQGSTFGGDLTEWEVKDWMHEALDDVMRD